MTPATGEGLHRLEEDLAIPFVALIYAVEGPDGEWRRRAEYPELPGCAAEADDALTVMELLDEARARAIVGYHRRGEAPPRPRPPLRGGAPLAGSPTLERLLGELLSS